MRQSSFVLLMVLVISRPTAAQQPAAPAPSATIMTAARLAQLGDSLTPGSSRTAQLGRGAGHTWAMTHRDSSGSVEMHLGFTDVFVVVSGSATLVSGGTLEGARETSAGEWRGGKASGSTSSMLRAGDVVIIPAGAPHKMLVARGEKVSYLAFKLAVPVPAASPPAATRPVSK